MVVIGVLNFGLGRVRRPEGPNVVVVEPGEYQANFSEGAKSFFLIFSRQKNAFSR